MKMIGKIDVTQRTATGYDLSESTRVYIVAGYREYYNNGNHVVAVTDYKEAKEYERVFGYVKIRHSFMLAGSWEEIEKNFQRIALDYVKEHPLPGMYIEDYGWTKWLAWDKQRELKELEAA